MSLSKEPVTEYKMVSGVASDIHNNVNHWLEQGWSLYGTPFGYGSGYVLLQAMIKIKMPD